MGLPNYVHGGYVACDTGSDGVDKSFGLNPRLEKKNNEILDLVRNIGRKLGRGRILRELISLRGSCFSSSKHFCPTASWPLVENRAGANKPTRLQGVLASLPQRTDAAITT